MYKVRTTEEIGVECVKCGAVTAGMHMCYERPGPVTALNAAAVIGYDKWSRDRGGGGAAPGADASWAGRDRERDRERERQARAHQMSHVHAAEPDASSLFPAPIRVNGNRDRLSQQIHSKLGDYQLAQALLDDPSKSIGICAEPQSPAPCPPSRRESEFKKPAHAPQNGRVHHRQHMYTKSEATGPTSAPAHRPPNLRINGFQTQIDSSQPPIESILKEMKSLPIPLSGMAATPRKEQENKFVFNHALNRLVQDNSQSNDLKTPITKPGFDSRISNSRISVSPDVTKDLGLSESEDEIGGPTTRLEPLLSPIGSGSPSSGSDSSDTETETSSGGSVTPDPGAASGGGAAAPRSSWCLSNFAPPAAQPAGQQQPYDAPAKELRHALADVKGKATSPISDMSDSESSSASPAARRRRAPALSSDDDHHASPRRSSQPPAAKRGRPPTKAQAKPSEPPKKRGRPRKQRAPPAPPAPAPAPAPPAPAPDSEPETEPAPAHPQALIDTKTQIFRRVFTPKKGDEGGGKGGKGGKGKGGKGKGQVTIIEVTAPETNVDDDSRRRRESAERRSEEAMSRLSPPHQPTPVRTATDRSPRDRCSPRDRATERTSNDRIPSERTDRIPSDRGPDRISDRVPDRTTSDRISDRIPSERLSNDRTPSDRLVDRIPSERPRIPSERMTDRMPSERMSNDRTPSERTGNDRIPERPSTDRLPTTDRVSAKMSASDRLTVDRVKPERHTDRLSMDRLPGDRAPSPRDKAADRFVRAEADVGPATEASSNVSSRPPRRRPLPGRRSRLMVRLPLSRLTTAARRALREPAAPRRLPALPLLPALPHLPHLPLMPQQIASAAPSALPRGSGGSSGSSGTGGAGQTPIYYSYFERLPADALSDEERDHKFYLCEATRLRSAAEREQEPLNRVMLYLESVLCFVLTGRVLELELDTKRAFTIYRETIEYIKSIHSMPQRFRASPHSTFSKLDILSLRVQALLYLRMFKMYNREVKEYYKIVQDYQQKVNVPACAESVSPLSPTPSPAGSVGSVGSGSAGSGASASSGYCSLAHAVPAHAHHALLQLNKYYTFLFVAFELWEQADCLCRLRPNQDLFIAVDRKCGPLTLFSTFRHLVQYVRHAISLLKNAPRE